MGQVARLCRRINSCVHSIIMIIKLIFIGIYDKKYDIKQCYILKTPFKKRSFFNNFFMVIHIANLISIRRLI